MRRFAAAAAMLAALAGCQRAPYRVESVLDTPAKESAVVDLVLGEEIMLKHGTGLYPAEGVQARDAYSRAMKVADGEHAGRVVSIRRSRVGPRSPAD